MRKSWIRNKRGINLKESIDEAIEYIGKKPMIRDVILSGGDPFLLSDESVEDILTKLRKIPHLEIIRIGSRAPVTLPDRITLRLCRMLKRYHPLYVITNFNHPLEITPQSSKACVRLVDAGIPVGNQTVLLKGVNDDLLVRLEDRFRLLTGGSRDASARQQTLRATVDWSYELLSPEERTLFDRLSVFAGGLSLEAAEAVCAGDGIDDLQVLDLLSHLADKSLIVPEEGAGGAARYRLLETVRQYAAEKLAECGETDATSRHLAAHLIQLTSTEGWYPTEDWTKQYLAELGNIRNLIVWARSQPDGGETILELSAKLANFSYNYASFVDRGKRSRKKHPLPTGEGLGRGDNKYISKQQLRCEEGSVCDRM